MAHDRVLACFEGAKVQELFTYLLLHRDRPHLREVLADILWADSEGQSRKYLRQALWQLQRALETGTEGAASDVLCTDGDWIGINPNTALQTDVAQLEYAWSLTSPLAGSALDSAGADVLRRAVRLYRGDLLEACYQDWCLFERERLQHLYLGLLDKLMDYCEAHGHVEEAVQHGRHMLRFDRAHERTHRRLMRLHYLAGDRTAALRQYHECAALLQAELGVAPARGTVALYEQIRRDLVAGVAPRLDLGLPGRAAASMDHLVQQFDQMHVLLTRLQEQITGAERRR
ncbi:MAG TPA: BTAD domain-containing putative transcriptional regulator [Thermomicrobiaceae bacterium]|nr:BTAD domain-containing putative transcriptional regulator [Thermomicrobiaceae bacterium]